MNGLIKHSYAAIMLFVFSIAPVHALPVVLDFDSLATSPTTAPITFGPVIEEDGFRLTTGIVFGGFGSYNNPSSVFYTGSTALFSNQNGGLTTLTQINGNAFSMTGINLAFRGPRSIGQQTSLTFTGVKTNLTIVTQTFNYIQQTIQPISSANFIFSSSFNDLLSVSWLQGGEGHQFDNIVVDGSPTVGVPEPSSLALLFLGLTLLYGRRKLSV